MQQPLLSKRGFYYSTHIDKKEEQYIIDALRQSINAFLAIEKPKGRWNQYKRILMLAKRCFPLTLGQWLVLQEKNPYLYGQRLECVFDLLAYLQTGQRALSIHYWYELLEDNPAAAPNHGLPLKLHQVIDRSLWLKRPLSQVLVAWCSHPRGIEDMLWTLNVFFGGEKPDTLRHQPFTPDTFLDVKPLAW